MKKKIQFIYLYGVDKYVKRGYVVNLNVLTSKKKKLNILKFL